jgi:hypothetical protein
VSGRTFSQQTSWSSVFRRLDQGNTKKASKLAEGIAQQYEEFMNRYIATFTNDNGDFTFDATGTFTFQGDVLVEGDLTLSGGVFQTDLPDNQRAELSNFNNHGSFTSGIGLYLYPYTNPTNAPEPGGLIVSESAGVGLIDLVAPEDDVAVPAVPGRIRMSEVGDILMYGDADVYITNPRLRGPSGTAAAPGYAFSADTNTGMYWAAGDQIGISTGGTRRLHIGSWGIRSEEGSAASPSFAFDADPDTGMYRLGTNQVGFAVNGTFVMGMGISGTDNRLYFTADTAGYIEHGDTNDNWKLVTDGTAELTLTKTSFQVPNVYSNTTASGANINVEANFGSIRRSTSSRKVKKAIKPIPLSEAYRFVEGFEAVTFKSRIPDDGDGRFIGAISEDVGALPLGEYVQMDADLDLPGLAYDRIPVINTAVLADVVRRLEAAGL